MSFVGYIPDYEEFEESLKREKKRWAKMTPEERIKEREEDEKFEMMMVRIILLISLPIIAFIIWVITY
jgi:hypothetical protein